MMLFKGSGEGRSLEMKIKNDEKYEILAEFRVGRGRGEGDWVVKELRAEGGGDVM